MTDEEGSELESTQPMVVTGSELSRAEWDRMSWIACDMAGHLMPVLHAHSVGKAHGMSNEDVAWLLVWWLGTDGPSRMWPIAQRYYDRPVVPEHGDEEEPAAGD